MGDWNKWKHWLIFAVCIWTLLATVFLIDRYNHYSSEVMLSRIWNTFGDVILLKWVTKYQTLLAGLAALAGGVGVIMAAKWQILENREIAISRETKNILSDVRVAHHAAILAATIEHGYDKRPFDIDQKVISSLTQCNTAIGIYYKVFILTLTNHIPPNKIKEYKTEAYVLSLILYKIEEQLIKRSNINYPLDVCKLRYSNMTIEQIAEEYAIKIDSIKVYSDFFADTSLIPSDSPAA